MTENSTFFGELADDYDVPLAADEKLLTNYVERERYRLTSMAAACLGDGIAIEGGFKGSRKTPCGC